MSFRGSAFLPAQPEERHRRRLRIPAWIDDEMETAIDGQPSRLPRLPRGGRWANSCPDQIPTLRSRNPSCHYVFASGGGFLGSFHQQKHTKTAQNIRPIGIKRRALGWSPLLVVASGVLKKTGNAEMAVRLPKWVRTTLRSSTNSFEPLPAPSFRGFPGLRRPRRSWPRRGRRVPWCRVVRTRVKKVLALNLVADLREIRAGAELQEASLRPANAAWPMPGWISRHCPIEPPAPWRFPPSHRRSTAMPRAGSERSPPSGCNAGGSG